ncbi:MAG: DinB family protein [Gemmatimonadaceae bacterium]
MDIAKRFLAQSRYYLADEYPTKIDRCLAVLPADALWRRPNASSNSIGNLLLHLSGNIRQWIVSGVGGAPDVRHRSAEFEASGGGTAEELMAALRATVGEADAVIALLDSRSLAHERVIQGRTVKVLDAVYHVVEHFSTHTGQIVMLTKSFAADQVQFYEDAGGLAIPRWRRAAD